MKTPYLLGIITVLLFGSFALSGMMAQAGPQPIETIEFPGPLVLIDDNTGRLFSTAPCPISHPFLIGGSYFLAAGGTTTFQIDPTFDTATNTYTVSGDAEGGDIFVQANALCANFNFPMGMSMVGGIPLDIDTLSLFIGAIGVNPVITGLVAITMGGVAAQAIWYVNSRRVKKVERT